MAGGNLINLFGSIAVLLAILVATSLSSNIQFTCGKKKTCAQNYNLNGYTKTPIFRESENITGSLEHGITIAADGKCFNPRFVFRGLSDLIWAFWELPELNKPVVIENEKSTKGKQMKQFFVEEGTPTFFQRKTNPIISLCQNIVASREINYKDCGGVKNCPSDVDTQDGNACRRYYRAITINPVMSWLDTKTKDHNYPTVEIANNTHISIDWGKAEEFKCGEDIKNNKTDKKTNVRGSITIKMEDNTKNVRKDYDRFKFQKDYFAFKELIKKRNPKCYSFNVKINVILKNFQKLADTAVYSKAEPATEEDVTVSRPFSTQILQTLFADGENILKYSKIETINKNQTYLLIKDKNEETPVNCLKERVTIEDLNTNNKTFKTIEKGKVDITALVTQPCEETKLTITVEDTNDNVVLKELYRVLPTVNTDNTNTSTEDSAGHLTVNEAKFDSCSDLKFEVECEVLGENVTRRILGYNEITKKSDEYKTEGSCKARAFLCSRNIEACNDTRDVQSEWTYFYGQPSPKVDSDTAIGSVTGSIFGVLAIAAAVVMFMRFKEKKTREDDKERLLEKVKVKSDSGPIPQHVVFKKDDNLGNYLIDITNLQAEVIEEFNALEKYDEENIKGKETTNTATTQLNLSRNRYKDMVPYDSKLVLLKRATGDPPSRYINASVIKFPNWDQKFLAVQAPKPNMFSGFWQLVMEHNITVIVMITGLVEGGKVKAHQYWPDENDTKMILDNGIEVELISVDKTRSVYHHRQFKVTNLSNVSMTVDHLLCVLWEDMTAPKDTKVLRDLVEQADLLADDNPGTIMVHCSAGVGRTGTFIGYYKMTHDNDNDEVDRIDPFETVLEMRRARTKMVQKPLQYHYMMKCLSDYVTGETSVYS